jgi:hypothetical protein
MTRMLCSVPTTLKCVLPSDFNWLVRRNKYTSLAKILKFTAFAQNNTFVPENPQFNKNGLRFASYSITPLHYQTVSTQVKRQKQHQRDTS